MHLARCERNLWIDSIIWNFNSEICMLSHRMYWKHKDLFSVNWSSRSSLYYLAYVCLYDFDIFWTEIDAAFNYMAIINVPIYEWFTTI